MTLAYGDRFCAEWWACTGTTSGTCAFDPVAAQACLDGEYVFIIPPAICADVCG